MTCFLGNENNNGFFILCRIVAVEYLVRFGWNSVFYTLPICWRSYEDTESKRSQIVKPETSTELLRCAHTS